MSRTCMNCGNAKEDVKRRTNTCANLPYPLVSDLCDWCYDGWLNYSAPLACWFPGRKLTPKEEQIQGFIEYRRCDILDCPEMATKDIQKPTGDRRYLCGPHYTKETSL